jgi:hypothetical protein
MLVEGVNMNLKDKMIEDLQSQFEMTKVNAEYVYNLETENKNLKESVEQLALDVYKEQLYDSDSNHKFDSILCRLCSISGITYDELLQKYNESKKTTKYEVDEKGFVIIDANNRPYWYTLYNGEPWVMYWHDAQKAWVTLKKVNQVNIYSAYDMKISDEEAEIYHELHRKFINER